MTTDDEQIEAEVTEAPDPKPTGEWVSMGGKFDYRHYPARERFRQLDRLIAAGCGDVRMEQPEHRPGQGFA